MTRHPRVLFRAVIIGGGVFACIVMALLWVHSMGQVVTWNLWEFVDSSDEMTLEWLGSIKQYAAVRFRDGWVEIGLHESGFGWYFNRRHRIHISVPLILSGVIVVLTIWRGSNIPLKGHCQSCNYDLTGNTSGVCPECGVQITDG